MNSESDEPKFAVDEDWKERVRAEREAARMAKNAYEQSGTSSQQPQGSRGSAPAEHFTMLVSSLAAQAMISLGQLPDPAEGHNVVRPELAKHSIDMLAMLEEKTQGNLSAEESRMLDDVLHQLRIAYLAVYKAPSDQAVKDAGQGQPEQAASAAETPPADAGSPPADAGETDADGTEHPEDGAKPTSSGDGEEAGEAEEAEA